MRRHTLESDFTALRKIDIREEIAEAPLSWFHFRLAGLIALVVFFDGYNTSNASYVIHYVMGPWHLTPSEAGFLVSSGLIGFMVGAVVQGKASDRFGRRVTLIGSLWIVSVFSLLTALLARSFAPFCILRFLTGLGLGTLLPLGITYMNEFAPRRQLNSFSTWGWLLGFAGGGVAASAVGLWLTPRYGWEILNYAGSLAIVPTIACRFLLPESIKFSALQGDRAAVSEMLSRLIPGNSTLYRSTGVTFLLPESNENPGAIGLLVSRQWLRNSLLIWSCAFFILFAIYGLIGWVPSAMLARGESFSTSFTYGALVQGAGFVGTLTCGVLADRRLGCRRSMMIWWTAGAVLASALAFFNSHWMNFIGVAGAGFFILGAQGILNNFTANCVETEVRATAVGMMLGVGRLGAIIGPYALGWVQQTSRRPGMLFFVIGIASFAGMSTIAFVQPVIRRDGATVL